MRRTRRACYVCILFFCARREAQALLPLVAASRTDPFLILLMSWYHKLPRDRPASDARGIHAAMAAVVLMVLIPVVELSTPLRQETL